MAALTATSERQGVIDFTVGIFEDVVTLIVRKDNVNGAKGNAFNLNAYIHIFFLPVWTCIVGAVILYAASTHFSRRQVAQKSSNLKTFAAGVEDGYHTLLQISLANQNFDRPTSRMAYLSFSLLSVILFAVFNSEVTAYMTAGAPSFGLKSFQARAFA